MVTDPDMTETHVPTGTEDRRPPRFRDKLWMAGVVALAVGVAHLIRRRRARPV